MLLGKDLAPYRTGKHSNPQNRAKIHQKYTKKYDFQCFWCIFALFCLWGVFPILWGANFFAICYVKKPVGSFAAANFSF